MARELTTSHWGVYEVERTDGCATGLRALREDPDPSPIGLAAWDAYASASIRVKRPAVRRSWLEGGPGSATGLRGREPFVEVSWERALELVSAEIERVRTTHGNAAIFGGSYGWSSAGRFHHAQSQVHRFLNSVGGYVRHVDSYSLGAARVAMPHIVGSMDDLMARHHSWDVLERHTRLLVSFGGIPAKNAQVSAGGSSQHRLRPALARMAEGGCRLVNISPVRDNFDAPAGAVEWIPIRPNTDAAAMLALACEIVRAGRHDRSFLDTHCVGFDRWSAYLMGDEDGVPKDADWAASITGIPATVLRRLAADLVETRSLVNVAWALQRADHGEQPYWACVALASVIGQIGLPGGGFAAAYGAANLMGSPHARLPNPTLPQGVNAVRQFIPVARITDMLMHPGESFDYNGAKHTYADIRLIYWAGGNPFHHHQDLNRLAAAWRSKPETIVVHEQVWNMHARMADIVLPATSTLERDDISASTREPLLVAMKQLARPPGEARDDYAIFSALAQRLGAADIYTEGRAVRDWLRHLYDEAAVRIRTSGLPMPSFDALWDAGEHLIPTPDKPVVMLQEFRADPVANRLTTPSGLIEIHSERVASFGYDDCPGHPVWREPREWLGSEKTARHPLHLISDQPHTKLHSQLDFSRYSLDNKIRGREPVLIHPADAAERGIADGDIVRLFNDRGACLGGARLTDGALRGVLRMATGAWWDPEDPMAEASLDKHGNPNVLTRDEGASRLSQGCAAQSCLVQVERFDGALPAITAFDPPALLQGSI